MSSGAAIHRVVVTGIGIISPIGIGVQSFWNNVLRGDIGVRTITRFDPSAFGSHVAAQADAFDASDFLSARRIARTERFGQFAVATAGLALDDAAFQPDGHRDEVGVWIGSALGGLAFAEAQHEAYQARGAGAVRPLLAISIFGAASTTNIALAFDLRGPNVSNANSCAAGTVAIGDAFRAVARGDVRAALAGGVEAPLSPLIFGAFATIGAMSERNEEPARASRPFDRDRDGFVMAEGAGIVMLERYDDARSRGARMYGEVSGFGLTADAYHMTAPQPEGRDAAVAMRRALAEAHVLPDEIELVDAHGSASRLNDTTETLALKRALGTAAERVPVVGTKGQHGHALGATGAWEAALSLLAIHERRVPRTVNLDNVDPACDLDYVREERALAPRVVLSNNSGFGGINASLVLREVES